MWIHLANELAHDIVHQCVLYIRECVADVYVSAQRRHRGAQIYLAAFLFIFTFLTILSVCLKYHALMSMVRNASNTRPYTRLNQQRFTKINHGFN